MIRSVSAKRERYQKEWKDKAIKSIAARTWSSLLECLLLGGTGSSLMKQRCDNPQCPIGNRNRHLHIPLEQRLSRNTR